MLDSIKGTWVQKPFPFWTFCPHKFSFTELVGCQGTLLGFQKGGKVPLSKMSIPPSIWNRYFSHIKIMFFFFFFTTKVNEITAKYQNTTELYNFEMETILEITSVHTLLYIVQIYFNGHINIFIKMGLHCRVPQHACHWICIGYFPMSVYTYLPHSFLSPA